jgi:hypothetical protein
MRSRLLIFILGALAVTLTVSSGTGAAARLGRSQTLLFDSTVTHAAAAGPDSGHAGHKQIARGVLRDNTGHTVGRFAFTCTWLRILADNDALEHCTGSGRTTDGRLEIGGPARESDAAHAWRITGGSGAYRGAHGTVALRDISHTEALIIVTAVPRAGVLLSVATVPRPAVNRAFRARANHLCALASARLAALPPFPFQHFDPLDPDPALLSQVGAFFTGPGDPRPIFRALDTRLRALGRPPADAGAWGRMIRARRAVLTVIDEQDKAALSDDVPAFVKSVHDNTATFAHVAISAGTFGATGCVM